MFKTKYIFGWRQKRCLIVSERFLEYEEWYTKFEDEINIELAETGADREMDFDSEREFDKRYEMYLNAR